MSLPPLVPAVVQLASQYTAKVVSAIERLDAIEARLEKLDVKDELLESDAALLREELDALKQALDPGGQ